MIALIAKFAGFYHVSGLASLAVVTAFLGGMQLIVLGVMGEYIARIHDEVKGPAALPRARDARLPGRARADRPYADEAVR